LTLAGGRANTYTGTTTVTTGALALAKSAAANAIGGPLVVGGRVVLLAGEQIADGAAVTVTGLLDLNGFAETIGSLAGSGDVALGSGTLNTGADGTSTTFSGVLSGAGGGLIKNGIGAFTLAGGLANTYSGTTTVNAGSLLFDKSGGVSAIAGPLAIGDGLGGSDADAVTLLADNPIASGFAVTVNGSGLLDLGGFAQTVGSLAGNGDVSLGSGTFTTGADDTSTTFSGAIGGTGGLTKIGAGALTLAGGAANTYSGPTTVVAGALLLDKSPGVTAAAGPLFVGNGNSSPRAAAVAFLADNQTADTTIVTIASDGLLDLADHWNTSGAVVVDGELLLGAGNGTLTAPTVTLSGGRLVGSGTLNADVVNGGQVSPGDSAGGAGAGSITISGTYTQTAAGVLTIDVTGSKAYDQLSVAGPATLDGTLDIRLLNAFLPGLGASFPVLTFSSATGTIASVNGLGMGHGQAFSPVYSPADQELDVVSTSADHLAFVPSSGGVAGQALNPAVQVQVIDSYGFLLTTDNSDPVTVAVADGPGDFTGGSTLTVPVSAGVATFGNLVLTTAGSYTLHASAPGGLTGPDSGSHTIFPAAVSPSQSTLSASATTIQAGTALTIMLTARDAYGNLETGGGLAVGFGLGSGSGSGTFGAIVDNRDGTFTGTFQGTTAGSTTISATVGGQDISSTLPAVTVTPASATQLDLQVVGPAIGGGSFTATVQAVDPFGNVDPSYNGSVALVVQTGPAGGMLSGPTTASIQQGQATLTGLVLSRPGPYTLLGASDGYLLSTTAAFTVAPTTHFSVQAGITSTSAGQQVVITVTALDAGSHADSAYRGTIHFTSSDPQAGLPADYAFGPGDHGQKTFIVTLKTAGLQTVTADDVTNPAALGTSGAVRVNPLGVSQLSVTAVSNQAATLGSRYAMRVTARDQYGNPVPTYTGIVQLGVTGGTAVLPGSHAFTAVGTGSHLFVLTPTSIGSLALTVSDGGHSASLPVNVVSAATHLAVAVSQPKQAAGASFQISLTALDGANHPDPNFRDTLSFTSPGGLSLTVPFTSTTGSQSFPVSLTRAGTQTITVTDTDRPAIRGTSRGIAVSPLTASQLVLTAGPAPALYGSPYAVAVIAEDPYGNRASCYRGTVQLAVGGGTAILPASLSLAGPSGRFTLEPQSLGSLTVNATDGTYSAALPITVISTATHLAISGVPKGIRAGQ
jgi:autotransporter-associated beta strand protein